MPNTQLRRDQVIYQTVVGALMLSLIGFGLLDLWDII